MSESEQLIRKVYAHMTGYNLDNTQRKWDDQQAIAKNWEALRHLIEEFLAKKGWL